jgi:pimeloyl-ACP methyl ester carboxylesterase
VTLHQAPEVTSKTPTGIAYDYTPGPASAPTLLFVHAGIADRRMWDDPIAALTPKLGALRVDLRGFGDSDTDTDTQGWTHAQDLADALDAARLSAVHVVAASFGAGVAMQLAMAYPERVRSLVLAPPGGAMLLTMTSKLRTFIDAEEAALRAGDLDAAVEVNISTWVIGAGRTEADVPSEVRDRVRVMQRRAFQLAGQIGAPSDEEDQPFDRASTVSAPTLLIVGAHDLDTSIDAAHQWAEALPHAELEQWDDAAHLPSMELPDRFTRRLAAWVTEHGH